MRAKAKALVARSRRGVLAALLTVRARPMQVAKPAENQDN